MKYSELDKYFTKGKPKKHNRIPRKLKKKVKAYCRVFLPLLDLLDLDGQLWYYLEKSNPDYKRFLIKQVIS